MKGILLASSAILLLASAEMADAVDVEARSTAPGMASPKKTESHRTEHHRWTLDEARRHAHEYADKLDRTTPQEWEAMQDRREQEFKKWKTMSPQQRQAYLKAHGGRIHPLQ